MNPSLHKLQELNKSIQLITNLLILEIYNRKEL